MRLKSISALLIAGSLITAINIASWAEESLQKTQTIEERLQSLEQKHAILERKYENDQEAAAGKAKEATVPTSGKDGFSLKSADGNNQLKISGYVQADYRAFFADKGAFIDQFLIRRARLIFDATVNKFVDIRVQPDFSGNTVTLQDAYTELKYVPWAKVRVGKYTAPVGLERIQSSANLLLPELGLTQNLVPNRDTGLQIAGDFKDGAYSYQAGIFNGVVDGGSGETDTNSGKDYVGRIFAQPFKNSSLTTLSGLGLGISGSIGDQLGSATSSSLTSGYKTDGQNTFFAYKSGTYANGQRKRVSPQAYWYAGPYSLFGDFVSSTQEIQKSSTSAENRTFTNTAWQVNFSYVLTGESTSFKGIKPRKNFDLQNHTWGALELTGRYAELKVDDQVFSKSFSDNTYNAKKAQTWTGGFNWYLNNNVKVTSAYSYTSFNGGAGGAANNQDRRPERILISRVQASF